MSETSKIVVIVIIILFATSLLMGVAFARVASHSEANSIRDTV